MNNSPQPDTHPCTQPSKTQTRHTAEQVILWQQYQTLPEKKKPISKKTHPPLSKIVKDIHQHRAVSRKARGIKAKEARSFWAWRQRESQ